MNKKLIAVAVASTFAIPAISQADSTWYGRVNTGISIVDADSAASTSADIKNISSRFGVKGSTDLGNGLSAVYRYEFGVASDVADVQDNNRLSFVGLSGSFGTVTMGRVWSALFNHVGTNVDLSQNVGGDSYWRAGGTYRTSNTLSYAHGTGNVNFQIDMELDGSNAASSTTDSWAAAGTFKAGAASIALGYRDVKDDHEYTGISAKIGLGAVNMHVGYSTQDDGSADNTTGVALGVSGGSGDISWWAMAEDVSDDDDGTDFSAINLNVLRNMGGGTKTYVEIALDDNGGSDTNEIILGLRKDF